MDKVVLDTDIIVDFLRSKEEAVALVRKLREKGVTLATTVINSLNYIGVHISLVVLKKCGR